ncbi:MAG: HD-GYP domain-containing protein [Candidatus Eremiobacteraeota bacterium]|nr:HD-GYP domain-containing protein [Candidatus Eremiobacteraeota bacterium]
MRGSFLARFAIVTAVVAVTAAIALSYLFAAAHLRSLERDLVGTSIGQTSALLTQPLSQIDPKSKRISAGTYNQIAQAAAQAKNFQEYVSDVRVYWPDGSALYPRTVAAAPSAVRRAISEQNVWRGPTQARSGQEFFTVYAPLVSPNGNAYAAVLAIDFSVGQMHAQNASEQRFVVSATLIAVALIFVSLITLAIAAQRELNRHQRIAERTFTQTMTGIAAIVDKRDPYTAGHSSRVAEYSKKLAASLGLKIAEITTIEHAALLHDLGKIGIPDAVLLKPAAFDQRERTIIRTHPEIASEILDGVEAMREIVPCILHHHERWDGDGYPRKLAGERIPLGARIIAVADAYDAMTTDRPYRRALSVPTARAELVRVKATQLDERCVEHFVALIDAGAVIPPPPMSDPQVAS